MAANLRESVVMTEPLPSKVEDNFTPLRQNKLAAWQPTYGAKGVTVCLVIVAVGLIPTGASMYVASTGIDRLQVRYDTVGDLADCPWLRDDNAAECLTYPCTAPHECASQQSCGMVANLGPGCPRQLDNLTAAEAAAIPEDCDAYCLETVDFTLEETLEAPVFLYYKLSDFFQNNRKFVLSRSETQMAGRSSPTTEYCDPFRVLGDRNNDTWCREMTKDSPAGPLDCIDLPVSSTRDADITVLSDIVYAPCGLPPWAKWNDTFELRQWQSAAGATSLICDSSAFDVTDGSASLPTAEPNLCEKVHIAWEADRDSKFDTPEDRADFFTTDGVDDTFSVPEAYNFTLPYLRKGWYMFEPYHKVPSQTDEDLMVWMNFAMLSTFHKLYRRINVDLPPGQYSMVVKHRFDVKPFGGAKYFVLSNAKWTGGKQYPLSIIIICAGCLSFVFAVVLAIVNVRTYKGRAETLDKWRELAATRDKGPQNTQPTAANLHPLASPVMSPAKAGYP